MYDEVRAKPSHCKMSIILQLPRAPKKLNRKEASPFSSSPPQHRLLWARDTRININVWGKFIFILRSWGGLGSIKMERVNGMNYRLNCEAIKENQTVYSRQPSSGVWVCVKPWMWKIKAILRREMNHV